MLTSPLHPQSHSLTAPTAPTAHHHHPHTHRTLSHVRSPARSLRFIVDRQWGGQCSARSHAVTHAVALTPLHTGGVTAIRPRLSLLLGVILSRAEAATASTSHHHHPHTHRTLSHVRSPARSLRFIVDRQWGGQCSARSHAVTHAVALTPLHTGGVTAIRPRLSLLLGVIL